MLFLQEKILLPNTGHSIYDNKKLFILNIMINDVIILSRSEEDVGF